MKLKLHSDPSLVLSGAQHVRLLDPFWECTRYDPEGNMPDTMKAYSAQAGDIFELVPTLEESDAALLPVDWYLLLNHPAEMAGARDLIDRAAAAGKRVIIFFCHGAPYHFDWPAHAVVFRTAVLRSHRKPNEFIVPGWSRDYFAARGGKLQVRAKEEIPVVGFCGYAPPLGMQPGKRKFNETARLMAHRLGLGAFFPNHMAHAARTRALIALSRSPLVKTNYVIRSQSAFDNQYGAFLPGGSVEAAVQQRHEFVDNLLASDYNLCARGWSNCSIRFFETLSLGRIPVLVDTDCALPFESFIDWSKYCVRVDEREIPRIGRRVREFHDSLSPEEFEQRQRDCRNLYEEWLSPHGFFKNLYRRIDPGRKTEKQEL